MAWNFRRRVKIAPGVHLNISKSGVSTSIGPRGAKVTFGKKGTYMYTGIPGTGLYSRTKLSGGSFSDASNIRASTGNAHASNGGKEVSENGCLFGLFAVCVFFGVFFLFSDTLGNPDRLTAILAVFSLALLFLTAAIRDIYIKRKTDLAVASLTNLSRYDYFLEKYTIAEKAVIEKADRNIAKVQAQLQATSNKVKIMFLQSYVDHVKYDYISQLLSFSQYQKDDMVDELDPLVQKAAEKIVTTGKCGSTELWEWFGYDLTIDRTNHILNQLCECGIIDLPFDESKYSILVSNLRQVNRVFRKAQGRSLLSLEEKQRLNAFFEQRQQELIGDHELTATLSLDEGITALYLDLLKSYRALSASNMKWEILSSRLNNEAKSFASTLVERKEVYTLFEKTFNFINPCKDNRTPFFEFKQCGISFYIYPEFVIAAQSITNFEVIDIKDFCMQYEKSHFVVTNNSSIPKDAKLLKYTYKYVNKNGDRDARYADNPKYPVFEYGDITIGSYKLTMEFSNSESAELFYKKYQALINKGNEPTEPNFGATEAYFNKSHDVAFPLFEFYDKLRKSRKVMKLIGAVKMETESEPKDKLFRFFLSDIIKCYNQLGHDACNLLTIEGLPMVIVENHLFSDDVITYDSIQTKSFKKIVESIGNVNNAAIHELLIDKPNDFFYLNEVFKLCGDDDLKTKYFSLLYRFFSVIAKADNTITPEEGEWLERLMSFSTTSKNYGIDTFEKESDAKEKNNIANNDNDDGDRNPIEQLQTLIGLSEVKKEVSALANFVKIQQEREKNGMKAVGLSYHCVFTGNPGTGKTTVARILAAIYKDLGILKKGHLVETDRSGLVAEYVGQTAVKTNKIIDSALDGVLFIDEAYSLVQNGGNDFGIEAIATLLKRMEDDRNRLIVVLAGYSDEMKHFIDSNPGLQSRFNRYIHFADYTTDELKQIFMLHVKQNQYQLDEEAHISLEQILQAAVEYKDKNFGNGRYVRNLFEKTIQNQAIRLSCQPSITTKELSTLKAEDLPANK